VAKAVEAEEDKRRILHVTPTFCLPSSIEAEEEKGGCCDTDLLFVKALRSGAE
jgi:hypothetical protein